MSKYIELINELGIDEELSGILGSVLEESSNTGRHSKVTLTIGFYPHKKTSEIKAKARIAINKPGRVLIEKSPHTFFYIKGLLVRDDQEQMKLDLNDQ